MTVASSWLNKRTRATGLDYSPIAPVLEQVVACTNPNDNSQVGRLIRNIFDITAQHEAGKQLPIPFRAAPKR